MKKYTIEDLAAGKVAAFITDKSQIPDLEKLLRLAFPKDSIDAYEGYLREYNYEYYFANKHDNNFWSSFRGTDLPKQHVKDFLIDLEEEWEPKPGEICLVQKGQVYANLEFIAKTNYAKNSMNENVYIFYNSDKSYLIFALKKEVKQVKLKIKLTLKEIADQFGIDVDRLEVKND